MHDTSCLICLETSKTCRKLSDQDETNCRFQERLSYVAPEMIWPDDSFICTNCSTDLAVACRFRERCLNVRTTFSENFKKEEPDAKFLEQADLISEDESRIGTNGFESDGESVDSHTETHMSSKVDENVFNDKYKRNEGCKVCGRKFRLKMSLSKHLSTCDGIRRHWKVKRKLQCEICQKFYTTEKILAAHVKKCEKNTMKNSAFQCQKCKIHYKTAKLLQIHKRRGCKMEFPTEKTSCSYCKASFSSSYLLDQHIKNEHELPKNATPAVAKTESKVPKSSRRENKFVCDKCNTPFSVLKELFQHYLEIHSIDEKTVRPYMCEICKNRFRTSTNLTTHMLYHKGNRTNICSICGKSFITKIDLMAHEQTHDETRNHKCDKCDKAFKTNTNLRTHCLIVHTDPSLWKYECRICKKRFPQKSNHDQHFRRHIGEKNFLCPLCKKPFTSKSEMQEHVGHHSNERAHKCEHCGKAYRKRHSYKVHLSKVHGIGNAKMRVRERKYECHICPGKKFQDKSKLARHLCTHSGLKPFPCPHCDKKFTDKSYLNHHCKSIHNDGKSEEDNLVMN